MARFGPKPKSVEERFWAKVNKNGPVHPVLKTRCWLWTGTTSRGYGNIRVGSLVDGTRRKVTAHRLSYEMKHGSLTTGMYVLHDCDEPLCVNPRHLYEGTAADNGHDMKTRKRAVGKHPDQSGSRNPNYRNGKWVK